MAEPAHLIAVLIALIAALASAVNYLCVRLGTEEDTAGDAVFVVIAVNVVVLVPLVGVVYFPDYGLTQTSLVSFVLAGFLGTLLGRAFSFTSVAKIGASRTLPITASWALVSTVLGIAFLGETLTPIHAAGVLMTVTGVAFIAWETSQENPDDLPRRELLIGLAIPFAAALSFGSEPIAASIGLGEGTPAPVGLVVKTVAAGIGFTGYLRYRNALPTLAALRSGKMRWLVIAGVANTVFLLGYYGGLAIAPVNVVTPLLATNLLFAMVLSALFMPERLERVTLRLAAATVVVVIGVAVITVYG